MIKVVFIDQFKNTNNWEVDGDWLTFKNQLVGVDHVLLNLINNTSNITIKVTTPDDNEAMFEIHSGGTLYDASYNGLSLVSNQPINSDYVETHFNGDNIRFEFAGGAGFQEIELEQSYPFYQYTIKGDKYNLEIRKDFEDDYVNKFISGAGYHSLRSYIENKKIYIEPGYFYIANQEYYMFNEMGVIDLSGPITSVNYVMGEPYFIVPDANIDTTFGYIKTPSNIEYDVEWELQDDGTYLPAASEYMDGYKLVYETSEDNRYVIPSGVLPDVDTIPLMANESYLVLTSKVGVISGMEQNAVWLNLTREGDVFKFYTYVEDNFGTPMEGLDIDWYYVYINEVGAISSQIKITDVGTTNVKGIAQGELPNVGDWRGGFFIWASYKDGGTEVFRSDSKWIQMPLKTDRFEAGVFQLDNPNVFWDCQQAKTAMGWNIWGIAWGSNPTEGIGQYYWGPGYPVEDTQADWESAHPEYEYPPINYVAPGGAETDMSIQMFGYYTIKDYCDYFQGLDPAFPDFENVYPEMRVAVDGYWGQYLISGADIQDILLETNCVNSDPMFDIYHIDRITGFDGEDILGTTGGFNDVKTGPVDYRDYYYVIYYNGDDYTLENHYDIRDAIIAGTKNFYFRGIAIYPILLEYDENIEEAFEQDWKIKDIISFAHIAD